jgi:hypothetical protein
MFGETKVISAGFHILITNSVVQYAVTDNPDSKPYQEYLGGETGKLTFRR